MAITVSASQTNGFDCVMLKVYVVTGGTESGGAATASGGFNAPNFSFTPNASSSVVVAGVYIASSSSVTFTNGSNETQDDNGGTPGNGTVWHGHYTGTVTSGTGITLGGTQASSQWNSFCAYEVEPSGTAAIDASTPAAVQSSGAGTTATTASFSPPSGAVLVALCLGNSTSATSAITVSDTGSHTWTERGNGGATFVNGSGFEGNSTVFTTTIPATVTYSDISFVSQYSGWF